MDKEETLALFARGLEACNAWAAKRNTQREALEEAGVWVEGRDREAWNEQTRAWHESARRSLRV